jgi:hypothetical protein
MKNKIYFSIYPISLVFFLQSCHHSIELDTIRETSNILNCRLIFGKDINSIKLENAFWLQTGQIDTTDEHAPINSSIIKINKKEFILTLINTSTVNNQITEEYSGQGYRLILTYAKLEDDKSDYKGVLHIENGNQKADYNVEGTSYNL